MSELNEILNYEATVSKFVSNKTYSGHKVVKTIFEEKLAELNDELEILNNEAKDLEEKISFNIKQLLSEG